ncbi:UDP-glucose:dolichyl-phosphate glucosyltransferase [Wilcoxina mikolae CBS 423.85]|nr:UDP-glucose:dolichyl-phosphate glucosyltransferase [Wilcoxina mikolae CBS 423.85]
MTSPDPRALLSLVLSTPPSYILTALVGLLTFLLFSAYLLLRLIAHHPRPSTPSERTYLTTSSGAPTPPLPLPDAFSPASKASLEISVIVPAYNESSRLPIMLEETVAHLHSTYQPTDWEILIIDDGSTDDTASTALRFAASSPLVAQDQIRVITLSRNRGKGGAVAHGMRHIRGKYAVFADADGATKFSDLTTLMKQLPEREGYGIAVGSRAHMVKTDAVVKRSFVRNFLMHAFHVVLKTVGVREIADTQCGFKLFSRKAVEAVFRDLRTEGWIFDIEVLLLAGYKDIPVVEVPVSWHEVEGTKMDLVSDSIRMAWDLVVVRAGYAVGVYTVGEGGPGR